VYAGGDIVTGAATVILAMGAGRRAAAAIKDYLGIRDTDVVYGERTSADQRWFGIDAGERNFTRLRLVSAGGREGGSS
jgi:glutamate synthase (NADPH/NADH) small chain